MTTPVQRVPNLEALIESGAKSFESEEELNAAISEGDVEDGELVIVAGRRRIAEKG
jgi:dihydroxyacid dehydratase/phosphogluconate dehydratase